MEQIKFSYSESILCIDLLLNKRPYPANSFDFVILSQICRKIQFEFFKIKKHLDVRTDLDVKKQFDNFYFLRYRTSTITEYKKRFQHISKEDKMLFEIYKEKRDEVSTLAKNIDEAVFRNDRSRFFAIERVLKKSII